MPPLNICWHDAEPDRSLGNDEILLYAVVIANPDPPRDALWSLLNEEERRRADRFRFESPRQRFVAARAALRIILGRHVDTDPSQVAFCYDVIGKPSLDQTRHPRVVDFNMAHSGDLAVVAVTEKCAIGVDVEQRRPVRHEEGIAQRYFHPQEAAIVLAATDCAREEAFFRCWTRKEAIVKAIGTGLQQPLNTFEVPVDHDLPSWIALPADASTTAQRCWLQAFQPCDQYIGAVATLDQQKSCVYRSLEL